MLCRKHKKWDLNYVTICYMMCRVCVHLRHFLHVLRYVKVLLTFCHHRHKLQIKPHGTMAFWYKEQIGRNYSNLWHTQLIQSVQNIPSLVSSQRQKNVAHHLQVSFLRYISIFPFRVMFFFEQSFLFRITIHNSKGVWKSQGHSKQAIVKCRLSFRPTIHIIYTGAPGGKDLISGECSLGQTIPI